MSAKTFVKDIKRVLNKKQEDELVELHTPFKDSLKPAYLEVVSAAVLTAPDAEDILDLCSGLGELACSLARAYPTATVTCSDASKEMVERALRLGAQQGVQRRLEGYVMSVDDLTQVPSNSQDVVTCCPGGNSGLMYTVDHEKMFREVMRVLKPGGLFIGTVWQSFELVPLIATTMGEVIQQVKRASEPPKPHNPDEMEPLPNVRLAPPIDPLALASTAAVDEMLVLAGFRLNEWHNTTAKLRLDIGQHYGRRTWKVGCMPVMQTLERMADEHSKKPKKDKTKQDIYKLAKVGFDKAVVPHVSRGRVLVPTVYRNLVATKPSMWGAPTGELGAARGAARTAPNPNAKAAVTASFRTTPPNNSLLSSLRRCLSCAC